MSTVYFAKLSGIRRGIESVLAMQPQAGTLPLQNFGADEVEHYFEQCDDILGMLRFEEPELFADFHDVSVTAASRGSRNEQRYDRAQVERLKRDIDQMFELYAHLSTESASGNTPPSQMREHRVFMSHGRSTAWREVQALIERDLSIPTLELAQEPNLGRTIPEKLDAESDKCDVAVIVMTAEDLVGEDQIRARENVIHEIGYFQGKYGRRRVCLLYEQGTNIPTNLSGLVYSAFATGNVSSSFAGLMRELKAMYRS